MIAMTSFIGFFPFASRDRNPAPRWRAAAQDPFDYRTLKKRADRAVR
jgi:hypothetical protein